VLHAEQSAHQVNAPDEQLIDAKRNGKRTDHDHQKLDWEWDSPLYGVKGDENDHRLVDKEEGITRLAGIVEPFVCEIQVAHADVENEHRPAPAVDGVQGPGKIESRC